MTKKEPKQNGLTMKQIVGYLKKAKGSNKFYWMGRRDSFKGSLRYQNWLESKKKQLMELYLILKIIFVIGILVTLYAILRNIDIIKIILVYFKDKLFGK